MKKCLLPLLVVLALAPFTPTIDLALARFFYTPALEGKGVFIDNSMTRWMYQYGEELGFLCGGIAAGIFLLSWIIPQYKAYRRGSLTLVLTLVLGAGLLVNSVLKEYWGRPRPKQVIEFGGNHLFRPFYLPNFDDRDEPQKSFPSGHATMGFYYAALCLVARRHSNRWLFFTGISLTIGMGIGLSLTRIAQGGHFFSDTLCAGVLIWFTAVFIDWLLFDCVFFQKKASSNERLTSGAFWEKYFDAPRIPEDIFP